MENVVVEVNIHNWTSPNYALLHTSDTLERRSEKHERLRMIFPRFINFEGFRGKTFRTRERGSVRSDVIFIVYRYRTVRDDALNSLIRTRTSFPTLTYITRRIFSVHFWSYSKTTMYIQLPHAHRWSKCRFTHSLDGPVNRCVQRE